MIILLNIAVTLLMLTVLVCILALVNLLALPSNSDRIDDILKSIGLVTGGFGFGLLIVVGIITIWTS